MNCVELRKLLIEQQIPSFLYNIDGSGRNDERLCLVKLDTDWNVFYEEKGIKTTDLHFESESAACEYIYQKFTQIKENIMDTQNTYLPLGSIVLLKGATQKLLVIARAINVQNKNKHFYFDYGAVAYPEGLVNDQMAYFNSDAISTIVFKGYSDIEDLNMIKNINMYLTENPNIIKGTQEAWDAE